MKKRVFIIHGWTANPADNWFPWTSNELKKLGFEVEVPRMPNTHFPRLDNWLNKIDEVVDAVDEQTFFIGHSLGTFTILKYLESLEDDQKIGGIILVSGFSDVDFLKNNVPSKILQQVLKDSTLKEIDFKKIKKICDKVILFHSDNDAMVPIFQGEMLHAQLGGKFHIISNGGHLNEGTGKNQFPELIKELLKISEN
jgi:uncharacterized protein